MPEPTPAHLLFCLRHKSGKHKIKLRREADGQEFTFLVDDYNLLENIAAARQMVPPEED